MSETIRIPVDVTNPGQFFACCGLLELAGRLWPGAAGYFQGQSFVIESEGSLKDLLASIASTKPMAVAPDDAETSPLSFKSFSLLLDWWHDDSAGGKTFKTWAGRQKIVDIALAMHATFGKSSGQPEFLFNSPAVLYDSIDSTKTVEPLYFDSRRAAQAQSIDVGFSPDAHSMTMPVYAAVEYLCLVGLQRFRPVRIGDAFIYRTWVHSMSSLAAASAVCGAVSSTDGSSYSFSLLYRTKYLKGFMPATKIGDAS